MASTRPTDGSDVRLNDVSSRDMAIELMRRGVLSTTVIRVNDHGDETALLSPDVAEEVRKVQWADEDALTLERVKAELRAKGYTWFSFDRATISDDGTVRFWFNGSTLGRGKGCLKKQPGGWFTLQEMRDEKFAEGCR